MHCENIAPEAAVEKVVVGVILGVSNEDLSDSERVQEAINLISSLEDYDAYYKANKHLNNLLAEVSPQTEESEEDAIRREAREMGY